MGVLTKIRAAWALALGAALAGVLAPAALGAPALTEFPASPNVGSITRGPDGAMWMTAAAGSIGRMTPGGAYTTFPLPAPGDLAAGIASGPDGNLWVTNGTENEIDRFSRTGAVTGRFPLPVSEAAPAGITAGPDGALWFAESGGNRIGRVTTEGVVTEPATTSSASGPSRITTGPDRALWFTEPGTHAIGRVSAAGGPATEYPLAAGAQPEGIAAGPDGALWFADPGTASIGRITTAGVVTDSFPTPPGDSSPRRIAFAADGRGWFSDADPKLHDYGRIDTAGRITAFPTGGADTLGVAPGPGCTVWMTEPAAARVARIKPDTCPAAAAPPVNVLPTGPPPPTLGRTANATLVKGTVLVRRPGTRVFVPLTSTSDLPVGTAFDTRHGTVRLVFATDAHGGIRTGEFYGGVFVIRQAARTGAVSELRLSGAAPSGCAATRKKGRVVTSRRRARRKRHLWGNAKGRFRTRGAHSAATVRGTYWLVEDRCDGTLTRVRRGVVAVRDFRRRRTVIVRARHSYLARARRR